MYHTNLKPSRFLYFIIAIALLSCNQTRKTDIIENKTDDIEMVEGNTEYENIRNQNNKDWIEKVRTLEKMKQGETLDVTTNKAFQNKSGPESDILELLKDPEGYQSKVKEPTLEEFEYSDHWRQEAYKATKKYIQRVISKKTNCKVISQGSYQPYLLKYLGNFKYLVKSYCEFDCGEGYNNPSYFWVEVTYNGFNIWEGDLINQRFAD